MSVFTQNATLDQGADYSFTSPPYTVGGVVQDLTGASCRMMLRVAASDQGSVLSITNVANASGSVVQNGTAGTVTIALTKAATAALTPGTAYQYDAFVDLLNGVSLRFVYGVFVVAPRITR